MAELRNASDDLKKSQITIKAQLAAAEAREKALKEQLDVRRGAVIADAREKRNLAERVQAGEKAVEQLIEQLEKLKEAAEEQETDLRGKVKRLKIRIESLKVSSGLF